MRRFTALSAAILVLAASAAAQNPQLTTFTLPNGLRVILNEDHTLPRVVVNTWFRVGSKDEPKGRSGFAHLFEHLMFMGTQRVPTGQFDHIMESVGGANNASTAEDRTNYYSWGPSNILETLLWLDADRFEALGVNIDQKKLDLQRDVVKNERRQTTENEPFGRTYEAVNALMFPAGHPYDHSVIGSMADLSAATVKDVQDFFATYYVPNNATLTVVGAFDTATVRPIIERLFGTLPRANDVPRIDAPPLTLNGVKRLTMVDKVEVPQVMMVWHAPAAYKPGDIDTRLAASILGGGQSSWLYRDLVLKGLASDVSTFVEPRILGSLVYIEATPTPGTSLDNLEVAIDNTLRAFANAGPTAEELKRQVTQTERGMMQTYESISSRADQLNEFDFLLGDPNSFGHVQAMYRNATPVSVKRQARETFNLNRRLVIRTIPESDTPTVNPRDERPGIPNPVAFTPPAPTEIKLANGAMLQYWQRPDLPMMELSALFPGGAVTDPEGRAGLASLTADMLSEGTRSLTSDQFAAQLETLGAEFSAGASQVATSARLSTLAANFGPAVRLFTDALANPRLDEEDFNRVRQNTVQDLTSSLANPGVAANLVALREFYGAGHPLALPASGTPASVGGITIADVRAEAPRLLNPSRMRIFAAGSLPADAVAAELNRAFEKWTPVPDSVAASPISPIPAQPARLFVIDRPGAVQTTIRILMPSTPYRDPNRIGLEAIGMILGGSFTSRLNQNLREDKGYTYGAGMGFTANKDLGFARISTDVRADVTGASLKEIIAEVDRIRRGDITQEEAEKAISQLSDGAIEPLGSLSGIVGQAGQFSLVEVPFASLGDDLAQTRQITAAQLNALVRDGIKWDNAVIVLVGDWKAIQPQTQGLNLPAPTLVKIP